MSKKDNVVPRLTPKGKCPYGQRDTTPNPRENAQKRQRGASPNPLRENAHTDNSTPRLTRPFVIVVTDPEPTVPGVDRSLKEREAAQAYWRLCPATYYRGKMPKKDNVVPRLTPKGKCPYGQRDTTPNPRETAQKGQRGASPNP